MVILDLVLSLDITHYTLFEHEMTCADDECDTRDVQTMRFNFTVAQNNKMDIKIFVGMLENRKTH